MIKPKLSLAFVVTAMLVLAGWARIESRYTFSTESKLRVEGTSTAHAWKVQAKTLTGVMSVAPEAGPAALKSLTVTVPASGLQSGNGTMDKKIREALKVEKNPQIRFVLNDAKITEGTLASAFKVQAKGSLTIAGATKPVQLVVSGTPAGNGKIRFTGSYSLLMTDFGIAPPTAMLGAMKTGDKVTVHFDVVAGEEASV